MSNHDLLQQLLKELRNLTSFYENHVDYNDVENLIINKIKELEDE